MLSPQPAAPQHAKATAAIDILFIEDSLCAQVGRPAPGEHCPAMTQTGRSEAGKQCSSYRTPTTGSGDADKQHCLILDEGARAEHYHAWHEGTISENGFSRSPSPLLLITVVSRDLMALHSERCC